MTTHEMAGSDDIRDNARLRLGERIRLLRGRRSQARLATEVGLSQSALSLWERGERVPDAESALLLARALGCSVDYLLTGEGVAPPGIEEAYAIRRAPEGSHVRERPDDRPMVGLEFIPKYASRPAAGIGAPPQDWIDGHVVISKEDLTALGRPAKHLAVVRIAGDSMEPTIHSGDEVIVDVGDKALRDGIWILALSNELVAKRIQIQPTGSITILSDNPVYRPTEISAERAEDLHVVGRVLRIRMREI